MFESKKIKQDVLALEQQVKRLESKMDLLLSCLGHKNILKKYDETLDPFEVVDRNTTSLCLNGFYCFSLTKLNALIKILGLEFAPQKIESTFTKKK